MFAYVITYVVMICVTWVLASWYEGRYDVDLTHDDFIPLLISSLFWPVFFMYIVATHARAIGEERRQLVFAEERFREKIKREYGLD